MAGNTFGSLLRITTFGESHGGCVGVVIDGFPSGFPISEAEIQTELDRRKPGQSSITTSRQEQDQVHIMSGVFEGVTTGTPILILAYNQDAKSADYNKLKNLYRPGHADFTYQHKYGVRDWRGGGRASARETLARVAAGAIAKKYLQEKLNIEILSYVEQIAQIRCNINNDQVRLEDIESNIVRCPDRVIAQEMINIIETVKAEGDSVGGVIRCLVRNMPIGLGEPVFDKLHADLGKAMLSINAVKGFEIGAGFAASFLRGSEHNDAFALDEQNKIYTKTNHSGGVLGGISNGEDLYFRVAFKPTSTIRKKQQTVSLDKEVVELEATGRHDPCIVPRAVPIVDAMTALVLMDHYLRYKSVS